MNNFICANGMLRQARARHAPPANWGVANIPSQTGRVTVVTGATGGLGLETAIALAGAGAAVVLTGRNAAKGMAALQRVRDRHRKADVRYEHLDLSSLASVSAFSAWYARTYKTLDLLVNNAGVMSPPQRGETADGLELQFGANYLGHYALTAQLLPLLRGAHQPRVVNLSSLAHRLGGDIHFGDLQWSRRYRPWAAYAQSKLAMLLFTFELQRLSDANGWHLRVNAAHPGYARTDLIANGPGNGFWVSFGRRFMEPWTSQSAADGALPTLYAATAPAARAAGYYGPGKLFEQKGPVADAKVSRRARDVDVARQLWDVSQQLSGASWPAREVR